MKWPNHSFRYDFVWMLPVVFLMVCAVGPVLAGDISISAAKNVVVNQSSITLGDIASVVGDDADLVHQIQQIPLGNAPALGFVRNMEKSYIDIRLRQTRIDPNRIALLLPDTIEITRNSFEVPRSEIERIALQYLQPRLPYDRNKTHVAFSGTAEKVLLSDADFTTQVSLPGRSDMLGSVPLMMQFLVKDQVEKKIWVTASVSVESQVVVAKKPINRRQIISEDMLDLVVGDLAKLPSNALKDMDDVVGKRALRLINTNEVLRIDLVEMPPVVKRNDIVTLLAEKGMLRITAKGEVRENGRRGERIRVINLDSNKEIYARVIDANTVRVEF
ncbi:flagellar basal body P-ring formation chaperone FlgA [Desulfatirhabdium butyrativorans]|uniref:flagellar basal body P-ring formation chaperone FlgA n=1 Tax=Desulfatirhabdium butyrativorans TaxID=340467 RepID=UPI0004035F68|nr:flagellar basal body P-ring formation chaperone FlgA [Desulfatirhabdium butyrativorans]